MPETVRIEIAWVDPERQILRSLHVPAGSNVGEALTLSGIATELAPALIDAERLGIFSVPVHLATPLNNGDRIEIYRALQADPKDARRKRATQR